VGRTAFDTLRCSGSGCAGGFAFLNGSVLMLLLTEIVIRSALPEQPIGVSKGAMMKEPPSTGSGSGLRSDFLFCAFPVLDFCEA